MPKISALNLLNNPAPEDYIPIVDADANATKRVLLSTLGSVVSPFTMLSDYDDLADAITTIGADSVTLFVNEDVVMDESVVVPVNVHLFFINGITITTTGFTLEVYSPANIIAQPNQQIFSGAGTVSFTQPGVFSANWWDGSIDDGATVADTVFTKAIAAAAAGSYIKVLPASSYYNCTGAFTINKALRFGGDETTLADIRQATANTGLIVVTASNVELDHLKLIGPQYAIYQAGEKAIYAYGADSSNYITGLKIHDCQITTFGAYAFYTQFVSDFKISDNAIDDIYQGAIQVMSCSRGNIEENFINDLVATAPYGIELSRVEHDSLVTHPRCQDITVSKNIIQGNATWKALGTHGGQRCHFINNTLYSCYIGIGVGSCDNGSNIPTFAPLDCSIIGNTMDSGVTDGSCSYGIFFAGALNAGAVVQKATGIIQGNIVRGYGTDDATPQGAIYIHTTQGLVFSGNTIIESSRYAMYMSIFNYGFSITGNTFIDSWSDINAYPFAIAFVNDGQYGIIEGNTFSIDAKSATYLMPAAVQIGSATAGKIVLGKNSSYGIPIFSGYLAPLYPDEEGGRIVLKNIFTYADFAAGVSHNFDLGPQSGWIIKDVYWSLDTEFSGGAVSAATMIFGIVGGDVDGFIPSEDIFTGAGTGWKDTSASDKGALLYDATNHNLEQYFCTAATTLRATIALTGDTGDHLTAGQFTIWVEMARI